MVCRILDGKKLAEDIHQELHEEIRQTFIEPDLHSDLLPHLGVILVGKNPASMTYVRNKLQACKKVGIFSTTLELPESITQDELLSEIRRLNKRKDIKGLLVQLPLPNHIDKDVVFETIDPMKDVDVFHPENVGLLVQGRPRYQPCTPAGVQQILRRSDIPIAGQHVVVINRSNVVGKPLSSMLIQENEQFANATVTVCHDRTPVSSLKYLCRTADIIVVAVGIPGFLTKPMVRPGATVIDVGITRVNDKLFGDVDDEVREIAGAVTPVPGGVGPVTCAMLLHNTIEATKKILKL